MLSDLMPIANLWQFGLHFAVVAIALIVSALIWLWVTPLNEIELIREGNTAASISFAGALIGFALPVAGVVRASSSVLEVIPWAVVALLVQLLGLWVASRVLHGIVKHIAKNEVASGVFIAGIAISLGILNAACMGG
jgi:putative membrane protein